MTANAQIQDETGTGTTPYVCPRCGESVFWLGLIIDNVRVGEGGVLTFEAKDLEMNREALRCYECEPDPDYDPPGDFEGAWELTARPL